MSQGAKMRPRHVILARPLLPQNPTSRPRRKGFDLTARITEGIEAAGRGALRPGSRKPDPRCGRACPECELFGELDIYDDDIRLASNVTSSPVEVHIGHHERTRAGWLQSQSSARSVAAANTGRRRGSFRTVASARSLAGHCNKQSCRHAEWSPRSW